MRGQQMAQGIMSGTEPQKSGLETTCQKLSVLRERLANLVSAFESKAEPVLVPDYPAPCGDAAKSSEPDRGPAIADMMGEIRQMNAHLDAFNKLIDRLDM